MKKYTLYESIMLNQPSYDMMKKIYLRSIVISNFILSIIFLIASIGLLKLGDIIYFCVALFLSVTFFVLFLTLYKKIHKKYLFIINATIAFIICIYSASAITLATTKGSELIVSAREVIGLIIEILILLCACSSAMSAFLISKFKMYYTWQEQSEYKRNPEAINKKLKKVGQNQRISKEAKLIELKEMLDKKIITQEEYAIAREKILSQ